MKFRNQLAVNLVKLLAPVHSYPSSEINIVDTAFNIADCVVTRIETDSPKGTSGDVGLNTAVNEVREKAAAGCSSSAEAQPEERRFFLITDEGLVTARPDESFEDFLARALLDLEGK